MTRTGITTTITMTMRRIRRKEQQGKEDDVMNNIESEHRLKRQTSNDHDKNELVWKVGRKLNYCPDRPSRPIALGSSAMRRGFGKNLLLKMGALKSQIEDIEEGS